MAEIKFFNTHNIAAYVSDPPAEHDEFKAMVAGLRSCRISHALTSNPSICKTLVRDFWLNASLRMASAQGPEMIVSTIQGKEVCVSEQTIREALMIRDSATFPCELPVSEAGSILGRMGYEGKFPPTIKKLLPPFWRFLFHTFFHCVSGRKGGADEISATSTAAVVALAADKEFNFSRFILNEMKSNFSSRKKEVFAMFPRFLQMIFDFKYPELERSNESYDVKALSPLTFGLMSQTRKSAQVYYKGTLPLEKFGIFAEAEGVVSPPPTGTTTPSATVAEEHMPPPPKRKMQLIYEVSDDEGGDDDDATESDSSIDLDDYDLNLDDTEASQPTNVLTDEELQDFLNAIDDAARDTPPTVPVIPEPPRSDSDAELSPSKKRKKIEEQAAPTSTASASTAQAKDIPEHTSPNLDAPFIEEYSSDDDDDDDDEDVIASVKASIASGSGSSSAQGPTQDPSGGDPNLEASIRLARHLEAEDAARPSQAGIQIGIDKGKRVARDPEQIISDLESEVSTLKVKVAVLEQEKMEQAQQISVLQANLGGLTAVVYDLKDKLSHIIGDTSAPSSGPTRTPVTPASDVTLQQYMSEPPLTAEESRKKRKRIAQKKKDRSSIMMMKSSDQTLPEDAPQVYISDLRQKKFGGKYGDRSGIRVWGYDDNRNAWVVKRKSGLFEYYAHETDFTSWTRVDLAELLNAPFFNPSRRSRGNFLKKFLEKQAMSNFDKLNLPSSFMKRAKDVYDPNTGKRFKSVMWPPTKRMKEVPLNKPLADGALKSMQYWAYDATTSSIVIKLKRGQYKFLDPLDLLMFGESDLQTLSSHQIKVHESHEAAAKEFTRMLTQFLNNKEWQNIVRGTSDVELITLKR